VSEVVIVSEEEVRTRRFREAGRVPVSIVLAVVFLIAVTVFALAGSLIAPDASNQDLLATLGSPSSSHWLGTDALGRDVVLRLIVGARTALEGPLLIAIGGMLAGGLLGILAGYVGGWIDTIISRWVDLMYSLPGLLIAIVLVGVLGGGYWIAVFVLVILFVPYSTRLVRGAALEQRGRPYVEAARVLGLSRRRIMFRHILPTIVPLIAATTVLNFAFALVSLSGLSFLGLGVEPGTADWGRMLAEGIPLVFENPLAAIAPGAAIVLTAASMNSLGDWVFDVLAERRRTR
jgi:peptide/nickel transport system permease protein